MYDQINARQACSFSPLAIQRAQELLLAGTREEPSPTMSEHPPIIGQVMRDLVRRADGGVKKYGTLLRPFNGRNQLVDLYQELLDAVCYCAALIYEEEHNGVRNVQD